MTPRTGFFLLSAALLFAARATAELKTYTADVDNSTKFPTDRRIYRGDCDPHAATPNAGDDGVLADDQCTCTPGINCSIGAVPNALICSSGPRAQLNCSTNVDCPASTCIPGGGFESCAGSEGRPNGGACDPSIAFPNAGSCPPGFPTRGSPEPPCTFTDGGSIVINDTGNGTPTLVSMVLAMEWDDFVSATTVAGIPGSTVQLHVEHSVGPTPNQTGSGSTSGTINWGALTGWSQTGQLFCQTNCPGGCGAVSACKPFAVFEGLGPPAPLKSNTFTSDPWVFTGDEFTTRSFEIVSLPPLTNFLTASIQVGGRLVAIPALPFAALGGLGAGLVYLGARAATHRSR